MIIYLDLNIFDRLEKIDLLEEEEKTEYTNLLTFISNDNVEVPYSNAHLNDLLRGWKKNPIYIDGHLMNIQKLTKDLCICQYWGERNIWWHKRDIFEFFNSKKDELDLFDETLDELFDFGLGDKSPIHLTKKLLLPEQWVSKISKDKFAKLMFPTTILEKSLYSLFADLYSFQIKLKSDYSFYKLFKAQLSKSISSLKGNKDVVNYIRNNDQIPKHLKNDFFSIAEAYKPRFEIKENDNESYYKVIETFYTFDLQGYKSDANFNNMFDDGLHTFYASHCDIFITNDDRCKYKAEKTFEKLNIKTLVIKSNEINKLKNL
ncbi:hypothetical protein [Chryseobacterium cheonjiense]|uniref:Uncharacterized protein n=1 Tax=Chryseobacterium cheonjiense TaxID=2728845 RepID=A0A7Y0A5M7_9FLAO|nr:hypothetical protein [Chryseobacterium cheonjiense]NML57013.1 hypothetical protein [Chryseobacterium cheonjiense]